MKFEYNFFFIRSEKPKDYIMQIPIPPENVEVTSEMETETVNIVNLGEVNILKGKKLREISFEASLPRHRYHSAVRTKGDFSPPEEYIKLFESAQMNNTPLVFVVTGLGLNMRSSVESFNYTYLTDYVDFSITLKEYKDFKAKEVVLITVPAGSTSTEKPKATSVQATQTKRPKTGFAVGDKVICSGTYWENSYGSGRYGSFRSGYVGKISHVVASPASGQTHPIHITTEQGGWLGWVKQDQLKHV